MRGIVLDKPVSGWGEITGCCAYGNELPGFINCDEFLD